VPLPLLALLTASSVPLLVPTELDPQADKNGKDRAPRRIRRRYGRISLDPISPKTLLFADDRRPTR